MDRRVTPTSTILAPCEVAQIRVEEVAGTTIKWSSFRDSFEAAVHKNATLTEVDKFNYLRSLLEGPAANSISGLQLINDNYARAIDLLKNRYGNRQVIITSHADALIKLAKVTSSGNTKQLPQLYDEVESHIQAFQGLKISAGMYGEKY